MTSSFVSTPSFIAETVPHSALCTLHSVLCTLSGMDTLCLACCGVVLETVGELTAQVFCVLQVPCTLCDMLH